jgi:Zn-dependent protease
MSALQQSAVPSFCPECGAPLSPSALSCPRCQRLTHSEELQNIATRAQQATTASRWIEARDLWVQSLSMLPPDTVQYRSIQARIADLERQIAVVPVAPERKGWKKGAAGLGPIALAVWKFKTFLLLILTKGKLLLLGLTKIGTLLSMLVSLGVYWKLWGLPFAAGLVLSIYVHEMGHVIALRRYGIPAGAPMFIPGFGALIRLRALSLDPIQDSRVGLAGPIYGFGAAIFCLIIALITASNSGGGANMWGAIAYFGAIMNLFNLIPVWQLDGARGYHSLTQSQRITILALSAILWVSTSIQMFLLIALGAAYRLFTKDAARRPDQTGFFQYIGLLLALAAVAVLSGVYRIGQ